MKLARAIHFDESDTRVFHSPARTGEWCLSGGFEFSNWSDGDMVGKARQAFTNGWMGLETFGRTTFVAVAPLEPFERDALAKSLAQHFVSIYGAPSVEAAMGTAFDEIDQMIELCEDQPPNTLLTITRELTPAGVKESYGMIEPQDAGIDQFAVHGSLDEEPHQH
ncbi:MULTISPECIES: DUF6505 family protein [Roseobacter]|uniref:Uncharacterized protein n=1 Tax=Roseobacter litoralis (strain ATCC 49566 / DSM 6996 / JCM 21268 / NBRC 15278 / OCh 149) TaxID=391595 RepID=F7ZFY4_ROSLO|nr:MULTISPECIES: DUF6505 family protein [Roseobacter]AEI93524.1 hypothetical protein RLO149_c015290 [Roseobacter litoralis Och 149]GIT85499.1 hypothetical protein ROBYS_05150 [Roseobacter sp. OBYS 0001]